LTNIHLEQAIVGRVIRALQKCFHPDCFRCQLCQASLVEIGFSKYNGRFVFQKKNFFIIKSKIKISRALCRDCHMKEKAKDLTLSQHICSTCQ